MADADPVVSGVGSAPEPTLDLESLEGRRSGRVMRSVRIDDAKAYALRACQLNAEIQSVLAAMRKNSKGSLPQPIDDGVPEDPLLQSLKSLRRDVLTWTPFQWRSLPPVTYLDPFLHVIATEKTNTSVTSVALSSVHKILSLEYFNSRTNGAAEAIHHAVEALTSCRFEIVDAASEEAVLMRILQVLLACLRCPAGELLSDRDVCTMVNTCFRVLNQSQRSDVLQRAACQTLLEMVRKVFARLPEMPAGRAANEKQPGAESTEGALTLGSPLGDDRVAFGSPSLASHLMPALLLNGQGLEAAFAQDRKFEQLKSDATEEEEVEGAAAAAAAAGRALDHLASVPEDHLLEGGHLRDRDPQGTRSQPGEGMMDGTHAGVEGGTGSRGGGDGGSPGRGGGGAPDGEAQEGDSVPATPSMGHHRPHGAGCMVEILQYLCSLLDPDVVAVQRQTAHAFSFLSFGEADDDDLPLLALGLISAGLELAGDAVARHPRLLGLVKDPLFRGLLYHGLSPSLPMLAQVFSLAFTLHLALREQLKHEMEAFLSCVLLRLSLGSRHGATLQQQEAALEALCGLCALPAFACEAYANYDCEIRSGNLFEEIASTLSKTAFPVNAPLTTTNVLALDALLNIVNALAGRIRPGYALPPVHYPSDLEEGRDSFWTSAPEDPFDPQNWVEFVQRKKFIKRRLLVGADHFNREPKKGIQFLQGIGLFPSPPDSRSVACFFRYTPGLSKLLIGDYLGEPDEFNLEVLREFTGLFDFQSLPLDAALRTFLESFRLPGEAQKISRILEAFAERFYGQCPGVLASKDTAYILAYSLIMLNTDQHNGQVKKKMTEEEFIRNNRKINDGQDLPREMLSQLYHSIAKNEIRITADASSRAYQEMNYSLWVEISRRSSSASASPQYLVCGSCPVLDRDVFVLIAGPLIAALSVVVDHTEDEALLRKCADGFATAARVCAAYGLGDLLDNLVISVCRFISLLNPVAMPDEPAVAFGDDLKAQLAAVTAFTVANRHGDYLGASWRNILDCVLRLHKLGLLPGSVIAEVEDVAADGEPPNGRPLPLSTLAITSPHVMGRKKQSGGLISRMSQLLLLDMEAESAGPTERQAAAQQRTQATIAECRVGEVFAGSERLEAGSLQQLANSLVWAAGRPMRGAGAASPEDEDTAVFCLDLLLVVAVSNAGRIGLLWPAVSECLAAILQSATSTSPLVERAILGLLRVCRRIAAVAGGGGGGRHDEVLLRSLQLILSLDARVAEAYCGKITREVRALVCGTDGGAPLPSAGSLALWRSACRLLAIASHHPEGFEPGLEALAFVMARGGAHVTAANFVPCMDAARDYAEARAGGVETSKRALDLLGELVSCLERWYASDSEDLSHADSLSPATTEAMGSNGGVTTGAGRAEPDGGRAVPARAQLADMWLRLAQVIRRVCLDPREAVRNHAVFWLQRCLLAGEALRMPVTVWGPCFDQVVFVLLGDLHDAAARPKEFRGIDTTLHASLRLVSKVFLHFLPLLATLPGPGFKALWFGVLSQVERCLRAGRRAGGEALQETATELVKNMLMVMRARGVLVDNPDDPDGLWEQTWRMVRAVCPKLRPEMTDPTQVAADTVIEGREK